jgi:hypothetical protein
MRTTISMPDEESDSLVTDALNDVYGASQAAGVDVVLDRMQLASLPKKNW